MYHFLDRQQEYLDFAREIADSWIRLRWPCGLFPKAVGESSNHIDSNVDFSISLRRLSELSGDNKYAEIGRQCVDAILQLHESDLGYIRSVDSTGRVTDAVVDPKYNGLLLKGIISNLEPMRLIYNGDYRFHDLVKDR